MTSVIVIAVFILIYVASWSYVYGFRGQEDFYSFKEYMRKGWPIFAPLNCFLYLFTRKRARAAIMDAESFPELKVIEENWQVIREEALALQQNDTFNRINDPSLAAHYDVGFRTFFKYGWRKFYLKWYGYNHESARELCPKTVEILNKVPSVNGAMFSILPPRSKLTRHLDPVAVSLRYHLGLATPNSDDCFISVDGQTYSWRDGDPLIFDETFIHFVNNDTDDHRLILMCDVERPVSGIGNIVKFFYRRFMAGTIVPNTPQDKSGWISKLFQKVTPIMESGKKLKKKNRFLYKTLNHLINAILIIGFLAILSAVAKWIFG